MILKKFEIFNTFVLLGPNPNLKFFDLLETEYFQQRLFLPSPHKLIFMRSLYSHPKTKERYTVLFNTIYSLKLRTPNAFAPALKNFSSHQFIQQCDAFLTLLPFCSKCHDFL